MYEILGGLRVIEASSFIAAPSCALYLRQLGAEVIRVDAVQGALDGGRWPIAPNGSSLYWEGLNKGKKSVALDLRSKEGQALLYDLISAPGEQAGILVTNYPTDGFLSYERLRGLRQDLIVLRVLGRWDGGSAVDYTVNASYGLPWVTGPVEAQDRPVNHVLPAWDLLTGAYAAFALLAALQHRTRTGQGQEIRISLEDVLIATLGNLGSIAETAISGEDRRRSGNDIFGAFGRDFVTADDRLVMIVAITRRQWDVLQEALGIADQIAALETELGVSFARDEGQRYVHRDRLNAIVAAAVRGLDFEPLARRFDEAQVCWSVYRTLQDAMAHEPALSAANPLLTEVLHKSGHRYLTPGAPVVFSGLERKPPPTAPHLGAHSVEVLSAVAGLAPEKIAQLRASGVVGQAAGDATE